MSVFTFACIQVFTAHQELGLPAISDRQAPEQTVGEAVAKLDDILLRQHAVLQEAQVFEPCILLYASGVSGKHSGTLQQGCFREQCLQAGTRVTEPWLDVLTHVACLFTCSVSVLPYTAVLNEAEVEGKDMLAWPQAVFPVQPVFSMAQLWCGEQAPDVPISDLYTAARLVGLC